MATIRAYTTIEQSRKLAEILPLESADMYYFDDNGEEPNFKVRNGITYYYDSEDFLCCWSLAALLAVLPAECECMSLEHINYGNNHKKYFMSYVGGENTEDHANAIDACYEMIMYLHKLNLL